MAPKSRILTERIDTKFFTQFILEMSFLIEFGLIQIFNVTIKYPSGMLKMQSNRYQCCSNLFWIVGFIVNTAIGVALVGCAYAPATLKMESKKTLILPYGESVN